MIVGVNLAVHPALAAEQFAGAVGDHFVQIHVGLRAAAGLPDDERKLVVVLAGDHFVGRGDDRLAHGGVFELPEVEVDLGRRALDLGQGVDQRQRHAIGADLEVLERALSLSTPEAVGRNFHLAHRVGFNARLGCHRFPRLGLPRVYWAERPARFCRIRSSGYPLSGRGCTGLAELISRCRTCGKCGRGCRRSRRRRRRCPARPRRAAGQMRRAHLRLARAMHLGGRSQRGRRARQAAAATGARAGERTLVGLRRLRSVRAMAEPQGRHAGAGDGARDDHGLARRGFRVGQSQVRLGPDQDAIDVGRSQSGRRRSLSRLSGTRARGQRARPGRARRAWASLPTASVGSSKPAVSTSSTESPSQSQISAM